MLLEVVILLLGLLLETLTTHMDLLITLILVVGHLEEVLVLHLPLLKHVLLMHITLKLELT